jgi:hypothetical protein
MHASDGKPAAFFLFLCIVCLAGPGGFASPASGSGQETESKSLGRVPDPVVVNLHELQGFFDGIPVGNLRVQVYRDGDFHAIPFQLDERGPLGELLLTQGLLKGKQRNPDGNYSAAPSFGVFSEGDEFVFLARHMGDRAPSGTWPEGAGKGVEVRAEDPGDRSAAWAYLVSFDRPPPLSPEDYIDYRTYEKTRRKPEVHVVSNHYHAAFTDPSQPVAQNGWQILQDGKEGPNIMRTFHSIVDIRLGILHFDFTLENIVPRRLGQIDGPVRVVRRIRNNVKLAGIPLPEFIVRKLSGAALDTDSFYYPDFFYFNGKLTVPQVLVKHGERSRAIFTTDLNRNAIGMYWMNARNQESPCLVDGVMSPQERGLDTALYQWTLLYGPPGGWMNILTFGDGFRPLDVRLYYVDNVVDGFRPEGDPAITAYGSTGYRVKDFHKIEDGKPLEFTTYIFPVDPGYEPGDEQRYVDLVFRPLEVSATAVLRGDAP